MVSAACLSNYKNYFKASELNTSGLEIRILIYSCKPNLLSSNYESSEILKKDFPGKLGKLEYNFLRDLCKSSN